MSERAAWIESTFGHPPLDPALWKQALTHGSRAGESNYERLEFLGDRVLGLSMAQWLFEEFPDEPEGMLSRRINMLVSGATCADVAREIGAAPWLRVDKGVRADLSDSDNVLGDVVEALLAVLYLERGFATAQAWVRARWADRIHSRASARKHPKAVLQEWAEANGKGLPIYSARREDGPEAAPAHVVTARVGELECSATASTKREAETQAATALMARLLGGTKRAKRPPVSARRPISPGRARA